MSDALSAFTDLMKHSGKGLKGAYGWVKARRKDNFRAREGYKAKKERVRKYLVSNQNESLNKILKNIDNETEKARLKYFLTNSGMSKENLASTLITMFEENPKVGALTMISNKNIGKSLFGKAKDMDGFFDHISEIANNDDNMQNISQNLTREKYDKVSEKADKELLKDALGVSPAIVDKLLSRQLDINKIKLGGDQVKKSLKDLGLEDNDITEIIKRAKQYKFGRSKSLNKIRLSSAMTGIKPEASAKPTTNKMTELVGEVNNLIEESLASTEEGSREKTNFLKKVKKELDEAYSSDDLEKQSELCIKYATLKTGGLDSVSPEQQTQKERITMENGSPLRVSAGVASQYRGMEQATKDAKNQRNQSKRITMENGKIVAEGYDADEIPNLISLQKQSKEFNLNGLSDDIFEKEFQILEDKAKHRKKRKNKQNRRNQHAMENAHSV